MEWRALTVCLLDEVAAALRQKLGKTEKEFPLVKVRDRGFVRLTLTRLNLTRLTLTNSRASQLVHVLVFLLPPRYFLPLKPTPIRGGGGCRIIPLPATPILRHLFEMVPRLLLLPRCSLSEHAYFVVFAIANARPQQKANCVAVRRC